MLFGGHGGAGYSRRAYNDTWLLNMDNNRWTCLICQGNPPSARSGHSAFTKDGCLFVFGGWNNDSQFNDLSILEIENKDWTDLDLNWSAPRWNHSMQLVEAIPSWRVFVFGGSVDQGGAGRTLGGFDDQTGCLCLGAKYDWSTPALEDTANTIGAREHCAMCYDSEESRLIVFGGWSNKWLDDVWQINVSSIVGPPYAIIGISPHLGPVTGWQRVKISGIGFQSTTGNVLVRFVGPNGKFYADSQGSVVDDDLIECSTPEVVSSIGAKECEVRLAIGSKDYTTTKAVYRYYLNTKAEKSLCFGPGLCDDQHAGQKTSFLIQSINELGENRTSGADEFDIRVSKKVVSDDEVDKFGHPKIFFETITHELRDLNNGQYEVLYVSDEGEVKIEVSLITETGKACKIRGSPFRGTFIHNAKTRSNEYCGPLMTSFVSNTMRSLDEFAKSTDAGIHQKIRDGDVRGIIKIKNHIKEVFEKEEELQRKRDEVYSVLKHMEREGIPSDKQFKILTKIGGSLDLLRENCKIVEKEVAPVIQLESDIYRKTIQEFEEEVKNYLVGLKKEG